MKFYIDGIAYWSRDNNKALTSWAMARAYFRDATSEVAPITSKPAASLLAAAERRRAPDTVALALEVAQAACVDAKADPKDLAAIFASSYGDLGLCDAMCDTLAKEPLLVSPTKFSNSVHNAAVGYWTMATGCRQPSTALAAYDNTFAQSLCEAVVQAHSESQPVLLVVYDMTPVGPLQSVVAHRAHLAFALVISAIRTKNTQYELQLGNTTLDAFIQELL